MIGSVALMLDKSFGLKTEAKAVWAAMQQVFADGFTTADLARGGEQLISTAQFGDKVVGALKL